MFVASIESLIGSESIILMQSTLSQLSFIFIAQLTLFLITTISLLILLWFLFQLYLIQFRNALIDPLTGIYNRKAIFHELKNELRKSERHNHSTSVAMIDIDFFKKYNDANGHVEGDNLLIRFRRILKNAVREYDSFGRYGGEEFILVFPETKLKDAVKVCERVRAFVEKTKFNGKKICQAKK